MKFGTTLYIKRFTPDIWGYLNLFESSVTKVSILNSQNEPKIKKIHVTIHFSCLRYLDLSITDLVAVSFQIQVLFRGCKFHVVY